eukprot:scaffold9940_cov39-Tisochrysis_lutea.AAC.2
MQQFVYCEVRFRSFRSILFPGCGCLPMPMPVWAVLAGPSTLTRELVGLRETARTLGKNASTLPNVAVL